jgi:hypothetical protein
MWIGTDDIGCSHDQLGSAMWIVKNVTGSFKHKFDELCGLYRMYT